MIDPRYMTAMDWAAQTTQALVQYGAIPILQDETQWRDWADCVTALPQIASVNPPRSLGFDSWQEWALRFNELAAQLAV